MHRLFRSASAGGRGPVVARSSVVATVILLFFAYLLGSAPTGSDPEPPVDGPAAEEPAPTPAGPGETRPAALPLAGKVIVVDPGHGGADPGALGVSGRTRESYNTLFVALDLKRLLERAGARVVMTREKDVFVSLEGRVAVANRSGADVFISIHNDSNPNPSIRGVTTYYYTAQSRRLAETVQRALSTGLSARHVGVFQRPFVVVRGPTMPSVLVELGFLTNWTDERLLADPAYRYRAAEAIYRGVVQYFQGA